MIVENRIDHGDIRERSLASIEPHPSEYGTCVLTPLPLRRVDASIEPHSEECGSDMDKTYEVGFKELQ
jgi:hypothetical protein